jgi:hydrogenase expression/formation protein HypC
MCLGIPGRIIKIDDVMNEVATVDICGVRRQINITCIIDADHPITSCINDWVLVHVGFAMSRIGEAQAVETLKILTELGEAQAEMKTISESTEQALG